jgi:hypothetical protein
MEVITANPTYSSDINLGHEKSYKHKQFTRIFQIIPLEINNPGHTMPSSKKQY